MSEINPDLATALQPHFARVQRRINTVAEGQIVSYDSTKNLARVKVMAYDAGEDAEPDLIDVPVVFPGSKRVRVRFGLEEGDEGYIFAHRVDPTEYWARGEVSEATLSRLHGMYCEFVPRSVTEASQEEETPVDPGAIAVGTIDGETQVLIEDDGTITITGAEVNVVSDVINLTSTGPGDYAALASKVDQMGVDLKSYIDSVKTQLISHVHPTTSPGSPTGTITPPPVIVAPTLAAVGSTKVALD